MASGNHRDFSTDAFDLDLRVQKLDIGPNAWITQDPNDTRCRHTEPAVCGSQIWGCPTDNCTHFSDDEFLGCPC